MAEKIICKRTGKEAEKMEKSPYPGPYSDLIWNNISQEGWDEWLEASLIMLNEYRMNLLDPKHAEMYDRQMLAFLNLTDHAEDPGLRTTAVEPPKPKQES